MRTPYVRFSWSPALPVFARSATCYRPDKGELSPCFCACYFALAAHEGLFGSDWKQRSFRRTSWAESRDSPCFHPVMDEKGGGASPLNECAGRITRLTCDRPIRPCRLGLVARPDDRPLHDLLVLERSRG